MKNATKSFWGFSTFFLVSLVIFATLALVVASKIAGTFSLIFLVLCFAYMRREIKSTWREEETWWQDNSTIKFLKTGHLLFVLAAAFFAAELIRQTSDPQASISLLFTEYIVFSFISWKLGRSALKIVWEANLRVEQERNKPMGKKTPFRSFRDEVLIKIGKVYLAK